MNESKHTPGPWIAASKQARPSGLTGDCGVVRWRVGQSAGSKFPPGTLVELPMHGAEGEANAKLISAAPELLSLLTRYAAMDADNESDELNRTAWEVIEKATAGSTQPAPVEKPSAS